MYSCFYFIYLSKEVFVSELLSGVIGLIKRFYTRQFMKSSELCWLALILQPAPPPLAALARKPFCLTAC